MHLPGVLGTDYLVVDGFDAAFLDATFFAGTAFFAGALAATAFSVKVFIGNAFPVCLVAGAFAATFFAIDGVALTFANRAFVAVLMGDFCADF